MHEVQDALTVPSVLKVQPTVVASTAADCGRQLRRHDLSWASTAAEEDVIEDLPELKRLPSPSGGVAALVALVESHIVKKAGQGLGAPLQSSMPARGTSRATTSRRQGPTRPWLIRPRQ